MRQTRQLRWLSALLLAPVAALAVSAASFSALRCMMSGLLIADTCCPTVTDAPATGQPAPTPAMREAACCERVVVTNDKAPATQRDRAGEPSLSPAHPLTTLVAPAGPPRFDRPLRDVLARAPGRSAPAFLLTHAFLI